MPPHWRHELGHRVAPEPEDLSPHRGRRNRAIEGEFPYLFLDGVVLKRSWAGEVRNVSVLVAITVGVDGHRQILGVAEGQKEDLDGCRGFLRHLKERGLSGVQLIISDACLGLVNAAAEIFPRRNGSAASFIFTGMCLATCRRAKSPMSRAC
jgi:hypothetical protein